MDGWREVRGRSKLCSSGKKYKGMEREKKKRAVRNCGELEGIRKSRTLESLDGGMYGRTIRKGGRKLEGTEESYGS